MNFEFTMNALIAKANHSCRWSIVALFALIFTVLVPQYTMQAQCTGFVSALSGGGVSMGNTTIVDGDALSARFRSPTAITVGLSGVIYATDVHAVRKINALDGQVVTIAGGNDPGYADGVGSAASFNQAAGIVSDASGNLYVTDAGNNRIRKISTNGTVTTFAGSGIAGFADGVGTSAAFNNPYGIAIDAAGNLYVADNYNHRIRKITQDGTVTTVAGNGAVGFVTLPTNSTGTGGYVPYPTAVTVDNNNNLYIAIGSPNQVIRMSLSSGVYTSLDQHFNLAYVDGFNGLPISSISAMTPDGSGNLYITQGGVVAKITPQGTFRIAGGGNGVFVDADGAVAVINFPLGIARNTDGELFITEQTLQRIRKINNISTCTPIPARYSDTVFAETVLNDGAISSVRTITVPPSITKWSTAITNNSALNLGVHYNIANVPSGLTAVLTKLSDSVVAISFTGNASVHASTNSVTNVQIIFLNASLENNNVGTVVGLNGRNLVVNFISPYLTKPVWITQQSLLTPIVGTPFNYNFIANGFPQPLYAVISGTLPPGMAFNQSLGKLSGTPSTPGTYGPITISASNSSGSSNTSCTIIVSPAVQAPIWVLQTPPAQAVTGTVYNYTLVASGSPIPTYSVISGVLPTGITLSSGGILSGTPTVIGTYTFTVQASNSAGIMNSTPITITVNQAPTSFNAQTPSTNGAVGTAYTPYTFVADGTPAPTYSLASGALPTGITLSATGVLFGMPTLGGTYTFVVQASNSAGSTNSTPITITVNQAPTSFSAQSPTVNGTIGTAYTSYTLVANGIPTPTYSLVSGTLPTGITLSPTGVLSGTPTLGGVYTFTVQASNSVGIANSTPITITVNQAPTSFSAQTPTAAAIVGMAYSSYTFVANGTPAPTYSLASGSLPTGITLSPTGILSGTPTVVGTYVCTIQASNSMGVVNSSDVIIRVSQAPTSFSAQTPAVSGIIGSPYTSYAFVANGTPTPVYGVETGVLPPGLSFSPTGVLSGTPTAMGTYTFIVVAGNVAGAVRTPPIVITINNNTQPPSVFSTQTPSTSGFVGATYTSYTFAANGTPAPTYSLLSGILPAGLVLSPSGVLSGSLAAPGTYTFTVQASNSAGSINSSPVTIVVAPAPLTECYDVTTIAGNGAYAVIDDIGTDASFNYPWGICNDGVGNLFVAERYSNSIRKIVVATGEVTTLAGSGSQGYLDGSGADAQFYILSGICSDGQGNLFVADAGNNRIRKIVIATGIVSTFAGSSAGFFDGIGISAQFSSPTGVCSDGAGNIFVADAGNNRIRKIVIATGEVTTLAGNGIANLVDGFGTAAHFNNPVGVSYDGVGNLFVADSQNNSIRKIVIATGEVTTLAGNGNVGFLDGIGINAEFYQPQGLSNDAAGNLFVADGFNTIRKIEIASGAVTTIAGQRSGGFLDGTGVIAEFAYPTGVTSDGTGSIYVADGQNNRIRKISIAQCSNGALPVISSFAPAGVGQGGIVTIHGTGFTGAIRVSFGGASADSFTVTSDSTITATLGGGTSGEVSVTTPLGIASLTGFTFLMRPTVFNSQTPSAGAIIGVAYPSYTFVANGTPTPTYSIASGTLPTGLTLSSTGILSGTPTIFGTYTFTVQASNSAGSITSSAITISIGPVSTIAGNYQSAGYLDGVGVNAKFAHPYGAASDATGTVYVADALNHVIRKISPGGFVTTFAGVPNTAGNSDGAGSSAKFNAPVGVAVDGPGNVYVADLNNGSVRKISVGGSVSTLATRADGLSQPYSVAVDASGNVYVADFNNGNIRKITPGGVISTFAIRVGAPTGVAVDGADNVYVADWGGHKILKIAPGGQVSTLAGSGVSGFADGAPTVAQFSHPSGVVVGADAVVYVADASNNRIRQISPSGVVSTLSGQSGSGHIDGELNDALFNTPTGVALDNSGNLYVAEPYQFVVRKIVLPPSTVVATSFFSAQSQNLGCMVDTPFTFYRFIANGTPAPTYAIASGTLPAGITLSSGGILSGTPTAAGIYTFTVQASNSAGSANSSLITMTVYQAPISFSAQTPATSGIVGTPFQLYNFVANGTPTPGYSVISGTLPAGLTLSYAGVLSGTPTVAGSYTFTVQANSIAGSLNTSPITITISNTNQSPSSFSAQAPTTSGIVGTAYTSYTFAANGTPTPTYNLVSGTLPTGLTLSASGVLSGTPTVAGSYTFTVQASNSAGNVNSSPVTITVTNPNVAPTSFNAQAPATSGIVGTAYTSYTFGANGTPAPTYSLASGTLPTGLTLSSAGVLSGTPTSVGTYTFTVQASNSAGSVNSSSITITVNQAPTIFSAQAPAANGIVGTAYTSYTLVADGTPTPTYSLASGTLPTGLTLSSAGILSGTPTAAGTYTFTVQASNNTGNVNSSPITITITNPNPNIEPASFSAQAPATSGIVGTLYGSYTFAANGTPAPTYSVASGTLPPGLTLSASGVLSGTPTAAGSYTFTVQASNSAGSVNSLPITITVNQAPASFSAQTPGTNGIVGTAYSSYTFVADGTPAPTYSLASGILPTGMTFSSAGVLSGTPTAAGTYTFTVQASNSAGSITSPMLTISIAPGVTAGPVSTIAGDYQLSGYLDGVGVNAKFAHPYGVASDATGTVYVADANNHVIRKISPGGVVTTFAGVPNTSGNTNGASSSAKFNAPVGVAVDGAGNVYVADLNNGSIRKISAGGSVSTLATRADGLSQPYGVAVDASGNVYVADFNNGNIRKITPGGVISTLAYTAGAPTGVAVDGAGNVYVADWLDNKILKIAPGGQVSTLAGSGVSGFADGAPTVAQFSNPSGVTVGADGVVYVADASNNRIRQISPSGVVSTLSGQSGSGHVDGELNDALFNTPTGVALDNIGNLYVAEPYQFVVRKIVLPPSAVAPSSFSAQVPTTSGIIGVSYTTYTFAANGTPAPTYSVASGTLPTGLVLSVSGVLSGTPTAAGTYTFTVQASNSAGSVNSTPVTITMTNPNIAPASFSAQAPATSGVVGTAYTSYTFGANGTPTPTYSLASGTLPTGLMLSSAGVLSGTPTAAGTYTFTVQASNSAGSVNSNPITITVTNPNIAPASFSAQTPSTSGAVGAAYTSYTFVANGTPAPTYSLASGTLPTGLTLSASGVLSGTPTVAGTYTFTVQASNSAGSVNSASVSITVTQPTTTITNFSPASATIGNTVTVRGAGFTGASVVRFGGVSVLGFTVVSDTVITARVGTGASGAVSVTTPLGTASLAGFLYNVPPAPIAGSFSPTSARPGDTVIIRGTHFLSASTVSFGGVSMLYTVASDSVIHAYISASAVSGAVNVITQGGTSNLNGFTFIPLPAAPRITSFTPNRASAGASVVITGTNFTGASRVKFGAFDAASFVVNSATQITAVVGSNGSSGAVSAQTAGGTFSLNGFTFVPPAATLSGFMPTSAAIGQTVIITGTNLSSALAVEFGGRSAVFTVNSDSQITATVPAGSASGNVTVTTLAGAASIAGFTFLAPPVISGFTPTSAGVGASVVIAGSNFTGADAVRIGGVVASFVVNSASQITATVPAGAASGSVSVQTAYGSASLAGFVFIPSPTITSFTPAVAGVGDVVTVNGTNFTGASSVSFGGVPAASFTIVSATRITAVPSASGASGDISITTPNGTGSRSGFSFAGVPVITSFTPTGATGGDTVTITGTGFVGVSTLTFGNTAVTSFTVISPTQIQAIVSPRGSTGAVRLVTPGGTASLNGFVFTAPVPVITGFSPAAATVEQPVTITGRNFAGDLYTTLAVSFGGRAAGRFVVVNDSTITAYVGGGATGSVSVRTPGGTANRVGFTFIPASPVITGFTPASAPAGATITISGNNFFGASAVKFGGIAGTSLVVVNDSTVTVRVAGAGATGDVTLTTPSGTGTLAGFTFIPAPTVSAFAPASASVGDTVTIAGTGFTGATAVRFGATAALRFTVVSDTEIQAVVNTGSSGAVSVVSPNGTGSLTGFTYVPPAPRITSFTPATAAAGTSVVINGNYFTGTTAVNFGGIAAQSFVINSTTRITAVVDVASASGDITVVSANGTGTRSGFTFLAAPPAIASFSPASAPAGGTVLIRGTGFTGATSVRFGGIAAASFTRTGDTLISARVAASGASGDVSVTSVAGTGALSGFVFIPAPTLTSFTPTSAAQGDTVRLSGTNFTGTTAVSFGGAAANIVSISPTQVVVLVGSGASGNASLTTLGGTATKTGFTYLPPGPRITGFTPATATPGTSVVISGSSFTGASAVSFGGVAAQSFVVNSATRITAVVPVAAQSGDVSVTTPLGTASMAGFTFTPVPAPVITSFTPTTMPSGSTTTTMTINGRNFTGATAVSVGGVAVPFTVVSATRITSRITGAITGAVSVTTPGGTATMAGFTTTSFFHPKSENLTSANGAQGSEEVVAGVSNLDAPPAAVYPNPTSDEVTITGSGFAEGRIVSVVLVNALGQTVLRLTNQPIGGILQTRIDLRELPDGAYAALLSDGVLHRVVRFVKR